MEHTALKLIELGAVFFGLGLLGRLAGRIGPPIPLYLIGVLLMAVIGPVAARVVEPVARWVRRQSPGAAAVPTAGS